MVHLGPSYLARPRGKNAILKKITQPGKREKIKKEEVTGPQGSLFRPSSKLNSDVKQRRRSENWGSFQHFQDFSSSWKYDESRSGEKM